MPTWPSLTGGDGSFSTAPAGLPVRCPLVGVNQGRLGFLTDISRKWHSRRLGGDSGGRYTGGNPGAAGRRSAA